MSRRNSKKTFRDFSISRFCLITINVIGFMYMLIMLYLYIGTLPVDKNDDSVISVAILKDDNLSAYENSMYIAKQLKKEDLIRSETAFNIKSFIVGNFYGFQEKEYELSRNMSASEIILCLCESS